MAAFLFVAAHPNEIAVKRAKPLIHPGPTEDHMKKTIPHASTVTGDAAHLAVMKHALEQMGFTVTPNGNAYYGAKNISVDEGDESADGESSLVIRLTRFHTDKAVEAAPHGLTL